MLVRFSAWSDQELAFPLNCVNREEEMETQQSSRTQWLALVCFVLSIFIVLIIVGTLMWEQPIYAVFGDAIGTVVEQIVIWSGLILAVPLGIVDVILGSIGVRKRPLNTRRTIPLMGVVVGALGILVGLFWWVMMFRFA